MQHTIEVRSLSYRYGPRQPDVLQDVNFRFGLGAVGILGPNGAGKSTLQRILASTLRAKTGEVLLDGLEQHRDVAGYRRRIGYLPQRFGYLPHFTVAEFVEYAAWLKGVPGRSVAAAARRAVAEVALEEFASSKLRHLSGGMLRRVGIAQAIVNEPLLLLLDEPTVGLDPEQRNRLRATLRQLAPRMTVMLSTHLTEDIGATCRDVMVLAHGSVVFSGTTDALAGYAPERFQHESELEAGYRHAVGVLAGEV